MTEEKSPLKGFRSIGVNPSSPSTQDKDKQSIDNNLADENLGFTGTNDVITSNTSYQSVLKKNICPKCGKENDKSHSFCSYCGGRLDRNEVSTPGNKFVVCNSCGNKNPDGAITCNKCGNYLNSGQTFPSDPTRLNKNQAPKFDPHMMPPPVESSFSESQQKQSDFTKKRIPTLNKTDFKNTMKNGNKYSIFITILGAVLFIFSISAINSLPSPFDLYPGEAQIRYYTPLKIYQFLRVIGILITLGGAYLLARKNFSKSDSK